MSRLIESILIRFPLPAFYFDASEDERWLIVDGLQRLSSIRKFVIEKKLRLIGLEFLHDLNGKTYDQLHRTYQRRIKECPVTVYLIKPGTPEDVKYSVFRRINTGGMMLNNQEIRNAMAKPKDRQLLERLATHPTMIAMLNDLSKRMMDQELVLRFWAFYTFDYFEKTNKKAIAPFLDKAMKHIKNANADGRQHIEQVFNLAITRCHKLLGKQGFEKKRNKKGKSRINANLFDVWMVTLAKLSEAQMNTIANDIPLFRDQVILLLEDPEFFNAITYATQKKDHIQIRYDKVNALIKGLTHD